MSTSVTDMCPQCNDALIPGKMFCPNCGQALAPPDYRSAIDAYVAARVVQELKLRTTANDAVIREVAFKAENEAISRLKRYWWIGALLISLGGLLLTLVGFTSIQDAKRTIVAEARQRVEPVVSDVEKRAQFAQTKLLDVENKLPGVTKSLNETAELAVKQRQRIEGQSTDVAAKITNFQVAATKANDMATSFQARITSAQTRLEDMTRQYDTRLTQISRAVSHTSIAAVYPMLDVSRSVVISNFRFDAAQKKPNEKWVNLQVSPQAMGKHLISTKNLESLNTELTDSGITVLPGTVTIEGPGGGVVFRAGDGPETEAAVIYFRPSFRLDAEKILAICSKYFHLPSGSPQLSEQGEGVSTEGSLDFVRKDRKLDGQIYISSPAR